MPAPMALDLRNNAVLQYWHHKDPRLARVLTWMESVEDWRLDEHPEVAVSLRNLGNDMQRLRGSFIADTAEEWLPILTYLSSVRALRLIEFIDHRQQAHKGALDLIQTAHAKQGHDEHSQLMIDRLQAIRTLDLLGKIFSPARLSSVTMLLRRAQNQS